MDLVLGGSRAGLAHYLWPALIGIQICLGFLFAENMTRQGWRGRVWQAAGVVLLVGTLSRPLSRGKAQRGGIFSRPIFALRPLWQSSRNGLWSRIVFSVR